MALLGKLLLDKGILTERQLEEALTAQERLTAQGLEKLLGDLLIAKGFATPEQIRGVLEEQQKHVVVCGACRVQFNVRGSDMGQRIPCPKCGRIIHVPDQLKDFNIARPEEPTFIDPGPAPVVYLVAKHYDGEDDILPAREGDKLLIGSGRTCQLRIEAESVEETHCEIAVVRGDIILTDKSKKEGVYVNGRKVTSCTLRVGDLVLLGHSPLMLSPGLPSGRDFLLDDEKSREALVEADPTTLVGRTIGKFRFVRVLGIGGMAVVLLAEHVPLNRPVAVKVLRTEMVPNRKAVDRFLREALAGARLNHANIVQTYDAGTLGGLLYISMEYVEGEDVGMWIKRFGRLPVSLGLSIAIQVALALDFAHNQGVIHRDVKPSNIMFTKAGQVKVLDLGIAKMLYDAAPEGQKVGIGTLVYMPPEQTRDAAGVDRRADIYSLGATLYKMLAGQPPYKKKTVEAMVRSIRKDPLPDPRLDGADIPQSVVEILQIAMAKEPENRFSTMREMQEEMVRAWNVLKK
jgi:hypothetical protein